jgi:hypothetical protein
MSDESSWRDTLYVWDGILNIEEKDNVVSMKWNGKWIDCENCADAKMADIPKRGFGEYIPSDMTFDVEGTAKPLKSGKEDSVADEDTENEDHNTTKNSIKPHKVALVGGEGWDMEVDGSVTKYKDIQHDLYLPSLKWTGNVFEQTNNLAYAVGHNEFAPFISVGWMRPGCRLTLGRRYLDEKDARSKWSIDELKKAVLDEIFHEAESKVTIPPWQCAALHSDVLPTKKKQKKGD